METCSTEHVLECPTHEPNWHEDFPVVGQGTLIFNVQRSTPFCIVIRPKPLLGRPWQIIPKNSPIILFFYSQIFHLLFSQTSPLFLHYSQTRTFEKTSQYTEDVHVNKNYMIHIKFPLEQWSISISHSCTASLLTIGYNLLRKIPAVCQTN